MIFNFLLCFRDCLSSLDAICIQVLSRNLRSSSPFSITRNKCPSAIFISAAILECKYVDVFMKRIISWIKIFRQSVALCNELTDLVLHIYYHNFLMFFFSSFVCLDFRFYYLCCCFCFFLRFIYFLSWVNKIDSYRHAFRLIR